MKYLFIILLFASAFITSCKEVGPDINFGGGGGGDDTTGNVDSNQQKIVLIQDFTATNCPNCPSGTEILDNMVAANPGRIEVVEVHEGILSVPLEPYDPVLKTQDGEDLADYLGPPPFWPCGAIDQEAFETSPGTFEVLVDRNLWSTYITQELDSPLYLRLGFDLNYNESTGELSGSVDVNFINTISGSLYISILITESGIVAAQLDGINEIPEYVHNNVLRDIITNYSGDIVTGSKTAGSLWSYELSPYTVSSDWNADSCRVIAYVSRSGGSYQTLQALGKPLKN